MIQRIQSVWLLLASVCIFLTIKYPYYSGMDSKGISNQMLNAANGGFLITVTTVIVGLLAFINIFLFKIRILQLRLCVIAILLEALLIFLYYLQVRTYTTGTYSLTAILHGAAVFFIFLAALAINKDEKLIKNSDRLR